MKKIYLCLLCGFCLFGCHKQSTSSDDTYVLLGNYAMNEEGIYLYQFAEKMISYYDEASGQFVPLCNQSDCNHQNEDCLAYALTHYKNDTHLASQPMYYDDMLYLFYENEQFDYYLCKANPDGSDRTMIAQFQFDTMMQIQGLMLYQGKAYFSANEIKQTEMEVGAFLGESLDITNEFKLYEVDLMNGEWEEIGTQEHHNDYFNPMGGYDGKAYFGVSFENGKTGIIAYDLTSKQFSTEVADGPKELSYSFVQDGQIAYVDFKEQAMKQYSLDDHTSSTLDKIEMQGDPEAMVAESIQGVLMYVWELQDQQAINAWYYDCRNQTKFETKKTILATFKDRYLIKSQEPQEIPYRVVSLQELKD